MKKSILSKVACNAPSFLFSKKPSLYIPFKGKFPVVEEYQISKWNKEFNENVFVEDCSEWFQETIAKSRRMEAIENNFIDYLKNIGEFDTFFKLKADEKADLLVKFMDKNCLDIGSLKIN